MGSRMILHNNTILREPDETIEATTTIENVLVIKDFQFN
jgi:hypothetical protein